MKSSKKNSDKDKKKKSKSGSGAGDRQTLLLISIVFLVGIFVGILFGRETNRAQSPYSKFSSILPHQVQSTAEEQIPRIAIVIDDVGYDDLLKDLLFSLPMPVTLAILPGQPYSQAFAKGGKKNGFEILLHQPMESIKKQKREFPGLIRVNMEERAIRSAIDSNLALLPKVAGMSNHMGSYATQDRRAMRTVLEHVKKKKLFFFNSKTTPFSVVKDEAKALNVPYLERDIFLDHKENETYIRERIEELEKMAKKRGSAIAVGHYRWLTLTILKEELLRLENEGFEIVALKELL